MDAYVPGDTELTKRWMESWAMTILSTVVNYVNQEVMSLKMSLTVAVAPGFNNEV